MQTGVTLSLQEMDYSQIWTCHKDRENEKPSSWCPALLLTCVQTNAAFVKRIAAVKIKQRKTNVERAALASLEHRSCQLTNILGYQFYRKLQELLLLHCNLSDMQQQQNNIYLFCPLPASYFFIPNTIQIFSFFTGMSCHHWQNTHLETWQGLEQG